MIMNNKKQRILVCIIAMSAFINNAFAKEHSASAQLADDDFVFNTNKSSAPWLHQFDSGILNADNKESFTHWTGYHSINPTLVLALIELKSKGVSNPTKSALIKPFGDLSDKNGFSAQLDDVLSRLARQFYEVRRVQTQMAQTKGSMTFENTAATQALTRLLQHGISKKANSSSPLAPLVATHNQLFGNSPLRFSDQVKTKYNFDDNEISTQKAATIRLQLPWSLGYSWIGGGSHGYDGSSWPHSSIDYAYDWPSWGGQTWSVRSAHGGTVSVLSSCQVRVTNSSGWATTYYHLSGVDVYHGQQIGANHHLGLYASNRSQALCEGGSSTGPHLHFSLLRNGYYHSLDNVSLSNYVVNTGRYSYDSNCSYFYYRNNNNAGRYFCGWNSMYNYSPR